MRLAALAADPRVTVRNRAELRPDGGCVVYWMQRAERARDNPALDVAIRLGNLLHEPVVVLVSPMLTGRATLRHYRFFVEALPELQGELSARGVGLVLRGPEQRAEAFAAEVGAGALIGDENPLREAEALRVRVASALRIPFWTVDADVVVPSGLLRREHWAAHTIRPHIVAQVPRFLVGRRAPSSHVPWPASSRKRIRSLDARDFPSRGVGIDDSIGPVNAFHGGSREARRQLRSFVRERLAGYAHARNHPELDGTSRLSPYLHFGQIGPCEVARAVASAEHAPEEDRAAFLEELIVRRELAVNFVRYNPGYDGLEGCEHWARATLRRHAKDRRTVVPARLLEAAESPDPLWNAAQAQMLETGFMHGYMRMYWAKRLLEWTASPEEAFRLALALNDAYELDGGDPNGYAGVAWAIGGKHDRAFAERPVFGKIRYMSPSGAAKKLDTRGYVRRFARATTSDSVEPRLSA